MTQVFVSYSRKDKAFAKKLHEALKNRNLETWIDWEDIPATADWLNQIHQGIEQADGFLFLLSPDSIASEVCKQEIDHAVQNGKRLIPIVVRDVNPKEVHSAIGKINWLFCRESDPFDSVIENLLTAINTDLVWVESHRRLQVRALEWDNRRDGSLFLRGKDLREAEEQLANSGQKDPQPTDLQRQYVLESRKAESRTRNTLLSASFSAVILLIGLTIWAFIERNNAIRQEQITHARQLVAQGQLEYEENPLLGVRLALEAWMITPPDDPATGNFVSQSIRELSIGKDQSPGGRLLNLGGDVEHIYQNHDGSILVIDHANAPGELRHTINGRIIALLSGKVSDVHFSEDAAATYFVVNYSDSDVPAELRRTADGKVISTGGAVDSVTFSPDSAAYFAVDYVDAPGELHAASDGARLATLTGKIERVFFSPDAANFIVDYEAVNDEKLPGELWRTAEGTKVITLTDDIRDNDGITFSPDPAVAYFLVEYLNRPLEPELRRTSDGEILYQATGLIYVTFSPDATYFLVDYYDHVDFNYREAFGELRRTIDGTLVNKLSGHIDQVTFSPDPTATYLVVTYENFIPTELRRARNGTVIPLTSEISNLTFSPGPKAAYYVVSYSDGTSELRRTSDHALVVELPSGSFNLFFSPDPDSTYFVLYGNENQIRRTRDGALISNLSTFSISDVVFSPDPAMTYFMLYTHGSLSELRRSADGQLISAEISDVIFSPDASYFIMALSRLPGELRGITDVEIVDRLSDLVRDVTFSPGPTATYFVVDYFDVSGELRRASDGSMITHLTGNDFTVHFSHDPSQTYFIVDYENALGELYNASSGKLIATLSGVDFKIDFSPDVDATYFLVNYIDGRSELWAGQGGSLSLVELGLGLEGYIYDPEIHRLVVWYTDGRAYLLDLDWLKAMEGNAEGFSAEELMQLACEGPLATGLVDESDIAKLEEYLAGKEVQACP